MKKVIFFVIIPVLFFCITGSAQTRRDSCQSVIRYIKIDDGVLCTYSFDAVTQEVNIRINDVSLPVISGARCVYIQHINTENIVLLVDGKKFFIDLKQKELVWKNSPIE